jgi:RNA polymerase sigma-70 factor, ECF subfamily
VDSRVSRHQAAEGSWIAETVALSHDSRNRDRPHSTRQLRQRAEEVHTEGFSETAELTFDNLDAAAVHQALDQIDFRHREVLVLHFIEDFSVAEIAAVIGCPEGTVKSRIYHAKKAMKEILSRGGYGI